ncbi:MAG: cyclic nucleotide-binding domain-containing protein, partial [Betaproteobacteria bacterium]|nr:cyclic nucleotide-binding domain-containing protein [Betaproteobacteria bacterium]
MAKRENETAAALKRAQLFRTLAPAALARLALNATAVSLTRGKQLCRSGERCPGLYLVVSGRVMLSIGAPRGASKVIELIGPGGHIGLAA